MQGLLRTLSIAAIAFTQSGAAGAPALARELPQSLSQSRMSFASVVERITPAVVNVYSRRTVRERVSPFDDEFLRMFGGLDAFGRSRERVQQSLGSGVIVRSDGVIVTNNHVIEGGEKLTVVLADRREFEAELVLADRQIDLAVLRVHAGSLALPTIALGDSDTAKVGDLVLAVGNPFGLGQTVTNGIISALARTQTGITDYGFFIQTDAAINPGNSGGALVTTDSKLVGINTAIFSRSGGSIGVGFAIPSNMVRQFIDQALSGGRITRPWFGAEAKTMDAKEAQNLGLPHPQGVVVTRIAVGSPADRAGLRPGDVIFTAGGFAVEDPEALRYRVGTQKLGVTVPLEIFTHGARKAVGVRLVPLPEEPQRERTLVGGRNPLSGATLINLSPAVNDALNIDAQVRGVMISDVAAGSIAQRYGFGRGDLVLGINGHATKTVAEIKKALGSTSRGWSLRVLHDGQIVDLQLRF